MAKASTPWSRERPIAFPSISTTQLADGDEEADAAEPIPADYVWRAAYKWMGDGYDTAPGTAQARSAFLHPLLFATRCLRGLRRHCTARAGLKGMVGVKR
jgi:hypothetical protein